MQEQSISQGFLAELENYRRNALLYKSFMAWKYLNSRSQRTNKRHVLALEYWSYQTMNKCFRRMKTLLIPDELRNMGFSKGKYLVYLAAATLLPQKSLGIFKCRIDKLINMLIEVLNLSHNS